MSIWNKTQLLIKCIYFQCFPYRLMQHINSFQWALYSSCIHQEEKAQKVLKEQ